MEINKFKLQVKDGIITINPPVPEYYTIAESIANDLAESGTTKWHEVCLKVIDKLYYHSQFIKSKIVGKVSYGTGFYPLGLENIKNRKFEEAKAYNDGYADAVNHFKETFERNEGTLIDVLDELMPCPRSLKKEIKKQIKKI